MDLSRALEQHRRGRLDEAARDYEAALASNPGRDDALHLLGLVAIQQGDPDRAVLLIGRAIGLRPESAEYHANLAEAYAALGHFDRALESGRESLRLFPENPDVLCNLGATLVGRGDVDAGIKHFREALRLRPDFPQAHHNLANALQRRGDSEGALAHAREAMRLDPESAEIHVSLGRIELDRGRPEEALKHCREAIRLRPGSFEAHVNLANVFQVLGRLEEAEASIREAIRLRTGSATALAILGAILEQSGDSKSSLATLREALKHDPRHAGVLARLATRLRDGLPEADQSAIRGLLDEPGLSPDRRVLLLFGLAHVLDAQGRFDRAAELTIEANTLQKFAFARRGLGYNPDAHSRFVDRLFEAFAPAFFQRTAGWGLASDRPIFVVGMPRSGTSLVEQILASHSRVFGAGELRLAGEAFRALSEGTDRNGDFRDGLNRLDRDAVGRLARRFLDGLAAWNGQAERVVDKMPENSLYLGLLAVLFPLAKIIDCRRDPRDVSLSCWMTDFGQVRWACDPDHIASRIAQSRRIMDHWGRVLPSAIFPIQYEELVDDLEGVSRKLVDRCGLEWEPACLDFHLNRRPVRTASTAQVRQPIYRGSIGRWKNYQHTLAPLFAKLGSQAISTDS